MANVLISCSGNKIQGDKFNIFPFYEGLMNSLVRNGNQVSYMIVNEFVASYNSRSNDVSSRIDITRLNSYLKEQNFDLIIAFNNACVRSILQKTDIPYIIWGVDPISVYADKEELIKNPNRYIFAGNCEDDYLNITNCFHPKKLDIVRFATDIRTEKLPYDYSISFVGSLWNGSEKDLLKKGMSQTTLSKIISLLRKNTNLTITEIKKIVGASANLLNETSIFLLLQGIASTDRIKVLSALTDLGLHTFGLSEKWIDLADTNLDLACSYSPELIYDLGAIQTLFNRSKINFNMSHIHATKMGFSFRVIDAMASNGCLVTDYKEAYKKLFGQYVDLPTFEYGNPQSARKVCEYILKHDNERKDIVKASNKAIDAGFRFEHRFQQIEQMANIKLFNQKKGTLTQIQAKDFLIAQQKNIISQVTPIKQKNKKSLLTKILKFPTKIRTKAFKAIYKKYFQQLPISMETGFNFCDRRFNDTIYRIDNGLTNPIYKSYHQKIYQEAYLAKCARKIKQNSCNKIRVVFLFQEASYWASVKTLYENLKADSRFEVFVVAIPVLAVPDLNSLELQAKQIQFLEENKIEYINACANAAMFDIYTLKPDYVFVQIHFDRQRPLEYQTCVMRLYTKVCLVPHAFLLSASDNKELSYQQDYFKIFVPNQEHADILAGTIHNTSNIEVTGYPRFDLYSKPITDCTLWKIARKKNSHIKRIIWSPHWWAYGHSRALADNVLNIMSYFIKYLELHKDVELIIKPHPNLFNGLIGSKYLTKAQADDLITKVDAMPNASFYTGGDYIDLFRTADLIVNNSISFLAEWLPTEKPMIFIDTERKFELNETATKILEVYYHVSDIVTLDENINDILFKMQDPMKSKRLSLIKQLNLTSCNAAENIKTSLIKHKDDEY